MSKEITTEIGRALAKALDDLSKSNYKAEIGWFENDKYQKNGISVALVAAQNELGNPKLNIPPRPFMRPAIQKNEKKWTKILEVEASKILEGKQSIKNALSIVAEDIAGDIRKEITLVKSPPLKRQTIRNRLRKYKDKQTVGKLDKPLIDSGIMLDTLTHIVNK